MAKTIVYNIKNKSGQTLGQYAARNATVALDRFMQAQQVTASQFKRMTIIRRDEVNVILEQ